MWKNFQQLLVRSKNFVDYETTNESQLWNFSWESVLDKTFNFITDAHYCAASVLLWLIAGNYKTTEFNVFGQNSF